MTKVEVTADSGNKIEVDMVHDNIQELITLIYSALVALGYSEATVGDYICSSDSNDSEEEL